MLLERKANLIIQNENLVQDVLDAVNDQIAEGRDWEELESMISRAKYYGDSHLVKTIDSLHLEKNSITVLLQEDEVEEVLDEDSIQQETYIASKKRHESRKDLRSTDDYIRNRVKKSMGKKMAKTSQ